MSDLTPRHRRWRVHVFVATWSSYAGFYFCRKGFSVVKGPIKASLEVDDYQLAHLWTAFLLAYMVGQFASGYLGARIACRRLLLVGMALSAASNALLGASVGFGRAAYAPMMVFMVVNGLAQSTGWPGNIGTLAHWFRREERGTVLGVWSTCYQLGSVAAKAFAAAMFAWFGVAWSFWGASLVLLAVWALFYVLQRDQPQDVGLGAIVAEDEPVAEASPDPPRAWRLGLSPALARTVVLMGFTYCSFKFLRYGLDSWAPLVLSESFALPTDVAGYVSTAFDWVGFGGVVVVGWASDRFFEGRRSGLAAAMAGAMVLATVLMWSVGMRSAWAFGITLALVGFTLFGPDSLLSGVGAIDVGSRRQAALAAGVINGIGSAGAPLQEQLIGYLKAYHSLDAVFALLVGVASIGAAGTAALWRRARRGASTF